MVQQLYSSVDLIFVGRFIGKEGTAAVGASTSVIALSIGFFGGLTAGAGILYARAYGARDIQSQKKIGGVILIMSLTVGTALSVAGFFLVNPILTLMQTPGDVIESAISYASIYFLSIMPMMLYGMTSGILRAAGNSRTPLIFQMISGGVNVFLDWVFITNMQNGIAGVALASVISQGIAAAGSYIYLKKTEKGFVNEKEKGKTSETGIPESTSGIIKSIFSLGVPLGLQSMMMTFSNVIVQVNLNALGVNVMSAFANDTKIEAAHWMTSASFGQATLFILSQNIGALKYERIRPALRQILKVAIPLILCIGAVVFFGGRFFHGFFTPDQDVIDTGMIIMSFTCPFYVIYIVMEILSNAIRSYGKTKQAVAIYLVFIAGLRIAGMVIFNLTGTLSIYTVSVVYPISWAGAMLCAWLYWRNIRDKEPDRVSN